MRVCFASSTMGRWFHAPSSPAARGNAVCSNDHGCLAHAAMTGCNLPSAPVRAEQPAAAAKPDEAPRKVPRSEPRRCGPLPCVARHGRRSANGRRHAVGP